MTVCGVICELNPFHYGHEYLFKKARENTGADYIIAIMSGDFVQRGMPAICDKYSRAKMALLGGADVVLEIPSIYASASADYYAFGAVSSLSSLGCVDFLCFGTESGDLEVIENIIKTQEIDGDSNIFEAGDENNNQKGLSYAKRKSLVSGQIKPNDMLASCYLKALRDIESDITPVAIKRVGSGYFDTDISSTSATAIRKSIINEEDIRDYVPGYVKEILDDISYEYYPIEMNDFSVQLFTRLDSIVNSDGEVRLTDFMDVSTNLEGRIKSNLYDFTSFEEFVNVVHSKEYTKSRVMRALTHILLDIKKKDYDLDDASSCVSYVRLLGFNVNAGEVLSAIKENCIVPVISKAKDAAKILDDDAYKIFQKDVHVANLYELAASFKYKNEPIHEFSKEIIKV